MKHNPILLASDQKSLTSVSLAAQGRVEFQAAGEGEGAPKRPRFTITGYTGAVVSLEGYYNPVIVDLAGLKSASQTIPILLDHDRSRIIGQTDKVDVDAKGVTLSGAVTGEDADSEKVLTHAKNGFSWQASIGASVVRQEFLRAGEKTVVNGREVSGPLVIVRESWLKETSFVAIGADGQTTANVAASNSMASHKEHSMFEKWLEAKGFDPAALSDAQKASLKAAYDAELELVAKAKEPKEPKESPPVSSARLEDVLSSARAEEKRKEAIARLTSEAIQTNPLNLDEIEAMAKAAIEAKSTPAEFELQVLRATRAGGAVNTGIRSKNRRQSARVIEAALAIAGNLDGVEKRFDQETLNAADEHFPHGLGLRDLIAMAARENGYTSPTNSDVRGLLESAFRPIRASGFSTLAIPGILSNTANKFLAQGFASVESGWRTIARSRPVRDFKTITSYSLTGGFIYEQVGPGGELKHATVGETSYTNKAETYGRMFAITRADIINDDLGSLTEVPMKLGRGAALKINDVFWTAWLAGVAASYWHADNANLISGGTTALSSTSLTTALKTFRKQTDPDGLPLGITPKLLLVPPELEITADELMTSTAVNTGGASTTDKVPNRNVWTSKFQTVMSTYLSNASYTGYSTTAWWLVADPMDLASIEVVFLNGRETPIVDSADADFNTLGIQMRGYHDFGVARQEYRASVRSAGA